MEIKFDYRFDTNGFFTTERQVALNLAGNIWSDVLLDEFAEVPENTELTLQNPQTGTVETIVLEEAIDDLTIFVGASAEPFAQIDSGINTSLFQAQYHGDDLLGDVFQRRISRSFRGQTVTNFEPWVGTISFASNPELEWNFDLVSSNSNVNQIDFFSVALQAIGRVLGVGTAPIFDFLAAESSFTGVNATEINRGNPIPLTDDLDYLAANFSEESLILNSDIPSERKLLSNLDLAFLADIGYEIEGFATQGLTPEIATAEDEFVIGTANGDRINALAGNDRIEGNSGDDTLIGEDGNDSLLGGTGEDVLTGGEGNDSLSGELENDLLFGGTGADILQGEDGNDTLRGNDDRDTLVGGEGDDSLLGNSDEDELNGEEGNDILRGGDASDTLSGHAGDDTIEGGRSNDLLIGAAGSDRFEFGFDFGKDTISDFVPEEDTIAVSAIYDFATDTYDFNSSEEIIAAITSTETVSDSTDYLTEITLRNTNTITAISNSPLTIDDVEIYFPFQSRIEATDSGFIVQLNQDFNANNLNLYQGSDPEVDIPDLRLMSDTTGEVIPGSLIVRANNDSNSEREDNLVFVAADSVLAPDDYTLTLFSRGDAFASDTGELLDGDLDGIAGDNFVAQFTVAETEHRILSIDDFSRGRGQSINISENGGLAVSLNDGTGVTQVDFTLIYDEDILSLEDIIVNPELSDNWTITTKDLNNPGTAVISVTGTNPLTSGNVDLVQLQATVPETATQNTSGIITIDAVEVNNGEFTGIGDFAYQQVTYLGDTNGDLRYTIADVYNIAQLATGISDGLTEFDLTNPNIIADINGDGTISAFDSYLLSKQAMGMAVSFIPDIVD